MPCTRLTILLVLSSVDGNDCPAREQRDNDFFFAIDPLANARGYVYDDLKHFFPEVMSIQKPDMILCSVLSNDMT